jgi:hypothetical protein
MLKNDTVHNDGNKNLTVAGRMVSGFNWLRIRASGGLL